MIEKKIKPELKHSKLIKIMTKIVARVKALILVAGQYKERCEFPKQDHLSFFSIILINTAFIIMILN